MTPEDRTELGEQIATLAKESLLKNKEVAVVLFGLAGAILSGNERSLCNVVALHVDTVLKPAAVQRANMFN